MRTYTILSGIIFLLVTALHAARLFFDWNASIGSWNVPMWVSYTAVILAGTLAFVGLSQTKK